MKLVVGSLGTPKSDKVVRVDIVPDWCDVCCDITKGIPLHQEFEEIECLHVLEHIQLTEDFIFVMHEFRRLLMPGGTLWIEVPHKDSNMAYDCIGHTRFFNENTFMNFYSNPYAKQMGYPVFKLVKKWVGSRNNEKTVDVVLTK
jgi:hypothetical protein